jgi:hypothetical protein
MSQEVVRKRYVIKPEYKKSATEEQFWTNTLVNGKQVTVKVGNLYRWGSFYIDLSDNEKESLLKKDSILLNDYEDYELIEMWDGGCDFWVDIVDEEKYSEEEVEEINTLLYKWPEGEVPEYEDEDDDGYSEDKMEINEWYETDCEYTLSGPYELDEVEIDVATECS